MIEAAVLGAVLYYPSVLHQADGLNAEDFYKPAHGYIWDAAHHLASRGLVIDPLTVHSRLAEMGYDQVTVADLVAMQADGASLGAIPSYVERIRKAADARRMISLAAEIAELGYSGEIEDARTILERAADTLIVSSRSQLVFEEVAPVVRGEVPEIVPTMFVRTDGQALLYPGLTHSFAGEPTAGKTMISLIAVAQVLAAGGRAGMLDYEGNRRIVGSRLRALGVDAEAVAERFYYLRPPKIDASISDELGRTFADLGCDLMIVDGVARGIARQGGNEDTAADVLSWIDLAVKPLTDAGAAVVMLDHVTKAKEGRGRWARGSGAKLGEIEGAAYTIEAVQPWSRTRPGKAHVRLDKDREGIVGTEGSLVAVVSFMPTADGLSAKVQPPDTGEMECEAAVVDFLHTIPCASQKGVLDGVREQQRARSLAGFRDAAVIDVLEQLVASGRVRETRQGRGKSNLYELRRDQ